jgi:hypothetical protein
MAEKEFKIQNGLRVLEEAYLESSLDVTGTITANTFVGDGSGLTGVSSYSAPTLGNTAILSGETVSTIAGLTLSNPSLSTASTNEESASSVSAEFGTGKVPGGLGISTVGGVKRYFIPSQYLANPDFLYSVPIGSNVTVYTFPCNDGVCGFYTAFLLTTSVYDGNSFAVTNYDGSTAYDSNFSTGSLASLTLSFVYSGTQAAVTVPSVNLRDLDKNTPASLYQLIKTKKIVLEKFEGNPNDKAQTVSTTWTVPAGVYSIDATLIGGGGPPGEVIAAAATQNSSSSYSANYGNSAGADTTIIYNGTTYTALGGTKGRTVSISETLPTNGIYEIYPEAGYGGGSGSSFSSDFTIVGNKRPGRGGLGIKAEAYADTYAILPFNGTNRRFESKVTARAKGENGNDGDIQHFTIPVIPGTTVALSVGQNGGEDWQGNGNTSGYATSNAGAIYIRYVR